MQGKTGDCHIAQDFYDVHLRTSTVSKYLNL